MAKVLFQSKAALAQAVSKGRVVIGPDGSEILVGTSRKTGRTVAQDKRDAKKARNRKR